MRKLTGASPRPLRTVQVKDAGRPATRAHKVVRERDGRPRTQRWAALSAVLPLALLPFAHVAPASATPNPLAPGTTVTLRLDKGFLAQLRRDRVKLSTIAPATLAGGSLTLPVSSGLLDPTTGHGTIETEGVFALSDARGRVPFKLLRVKTTRQPLIAKVGGSQLVLAAARRIAFARQGFGSQFSAGGVTLARNVAVRLDKKLRPRAPFSAGEAIGTVTAQTQPLVISLLERGRATLLFDAAFVAKLESLHVALNPIFPAEHQGAEFSFPIISGGAIAADATQGTMRSGGEVELLQLGGGQVFWHEPWLDLGFRQLSVEANIQPSPPYEGKTGRIGIAALGSLAVSSDPIARTIAVSGAGLALDPETAATLNEAFANGAEVFRAGEALGSLSFTAQAQ